jgi:Gamma-glutamyltranspeptidase
VLLNDEMDDFTAKIGVPNLYGLVQGEANAIASGKLPLSSMSPTIVTKDGKPVIVVGTPGGSRIITAVLQTMINAIDYDMNAQEAAHMPRFHQQWLPDPDQSGELRAVTGHPQDPRGQGPQVRSAATGQPPGGNHHRRTVADGQAGRQQSHLRGERPAPQHRAGCRLLIVIARSNKVASAGSSRRERSGRRDIVNTSTLRSTKHARKLFLGCQFMRFRQLIAKNAGHDVTLENNAQETFHQILDFVHHAVPTARRSDALV